MSESRYRKNLDPDVEKCSEFPSYYQELHRCRMHSTPPVVFFTLSEEVTRGGKLSWVSSFSSANKRQNKKQPTARGGGRELCRFSTTVLWRGRIIHEHIVQCFVFDEILSKNLLKSVDEFYRYSDKSELFSRICNKIRIRTRIRPLIPL